MLCLKTLLLRLWYNCKYMAVVFIAPGYGMLVVNSKSKKKKTGLLLGLRFTILSVLFKAF